MAVISKARFLLAAAFTKNGILPMAAPAPMIANTIPDEIPENAVPIELCELEVPPELTIKPVATTANPPDKSIIPFVFWVLLFAR